MDVFKLEAGRQFLGGLASIVMLAYTVVAGASEDTSEMSFLEKLRAQEEQEYLALQNDIVTMSDVEYKVVLAKRMEGVFTGTSSTRKLAIVVDVSDQMNRGVFQKLLESQSEPKMMGVNAVQAMLRKQGVSGASELTLKRQESSDDGSLHYQKVEGMFTKPAYKSLLANPKVTDIIVVKSSNTPATMETFYVPKGRILPAPVAKTYDDNFIHEGYYKELMNRLDSVNTESITISFHQEEGYYDSFTIGKEQERFQKIEKFLRDIEHLNIEVNHKLAFAIYARVDREAAKAIYEDPRVNFIRLLKKDEGFYQ